MRQVLFLIPLDKTITLGPFTIPWFGVGILLALWIGVGICMFLARRIAKTENTNSDVLQTRIVWFIMAGLMAASRQLARHFQQPGIPIFGYGFMLFVGFVTAVILASRRAEKEGMTPEIIWDLAPWILIPGILGARTFFCVQHPQFVFFGCRNAMECLLAFLNLSRGGLVLYGGLMGGAVGYFEYCRRMKLHPLGLGDLITPSIFVGIGFGRIGCLLNGCCYGDACSLPWAIHFPKGSVPFLSLVEKGFLSVDAACTPGLHPTQIYSALDGFLIAWLTAMYYPYRRRNGEVFGVGLMVYATTRFLIEFLRGDEPGQLGTILTISQWISMGMFVIGLLVLLDRARRPAFREIVRT